MRQNYSRLVRTGAVAILAGVVGILLAPSIATRSSCADETPSRSANTKKSETKHTETKSAGSGNSASSDDGSADAKTDAKLAANPDDGSRQPNLALPTMGGNQFWTDELVHGDWRIQRHVTTDHYRLLDPKDVRQAWGTWEQCRGRWDELRAERNIAPIRGEVVVLVHGLGRTRHSMQPIADFLRKDERFTVISFGYASTRQPVEEHAKALDKVLANLSGATTIHFVAHSLGNIVIRHYLADLEMAAAEAAPEAKQGRPPFGRMVMLGPPNNGAAMARTLRNTGVFPLIAGPSGQSLGRDWEQLVGKLTTPSFEFGIIAGAVSERTGSNPLVPGDDDMIVAVEETRLPGARDFVTVPEFHVMLLRNETVHEYLRRFLLEGRFRAEGERQPIARAAGSND